MSRKPLLLLVFFFLSCEGTKVSVKLNYPEEKISAVLVDLYIAAAALENINDDEQDSLRLIYINQIEKIHTVDMDLIDDDIELLQQRPELYEAIHKTAKDSLVSMESKFKKVKNN